MKASSKTEIARNKYEITATIDKENKLPAVNSGKDPSWVLHLDEVSIKIPDTSGMKEGDTITFFMTTSSTNNDDTPSVDVKNSNGEIVGKITGKIALWSVRYQQLNNFELANMKFDEDALREAETRVQNTYEVTFTVNKNITHTKDLSIKYGFEKWSPIGHRPENWKGYLTIRDSNNDVLASREMLWKGAGYASGSQGAWPKETFETSDSKQLNINDIWVAEDFSQTQFVMPSFATFNPRTSADYFVKGTKVSIKLNKDFLLHMYFKKDHKVTYSWSVLKDGKKAHGQEIQVGDVVQFQSRTPLNTKESKQVNGWFAEPSKPFKLKITKYTEDEVEFEFLEGMSAQGSEFKSLFDVQGNVVIESYDQIVDPATGKFRSPESMYKIKILRPDGALREYKTTGRYLIPRTIFESSGSLTPRYSTQLTAVDKSGNVLHENVGLSGLKKAGETCSIKPREITVDKVVYEPKEKEITGTQADKFEKRKVEYQPSREKNKRTVLVRYVDESKKVLKEVELLKDVALETPYDANSIKTLDGYAFISSDRPLTGKVQLDQQPITITLKKITTTFVDDDSVEGGTQKVEKDGSVDGNRVVKVGTKPKVTTREIPFTTTFEEDETLEPGTKQTKTEGVPGVETTTITYSVNKETGQVTANEPKVETKAPVNKVVSVGGKPTTVTTEIPFTTEFEADDTIESGQQVVVHEGVVGTKSITTVYSVDSKSGETTSKEEEPVIVEPQKKVVKVGTKSTITTKEIPFNTEFISDDTLEFGQERIDNAGEVGIETTTITHSLNKETGEITSSEPKVETKDPVNKVIVRGTKPTVTTQEIPFEIQTVDDSDLPEGESKVTTDGKPGSVTTTIHYTLNKETGEVTKDEPVVEETKPTTKVIRRGTKKAPVPDIEVKKPVEKPIEKQPEKQPETSQQTTQSVVKTRIAIYKDENGKELGRDEFTDINSFTPRQFDGYELTNKKVEGSTIVYSFRKVKDDRKPALPKTGGGSGIIASVGAMFATIGSAFGFTRKRRSRK
jgi:G5 domain protein